MRCHWSTVEPGCLEPNKPMVPTAPNELDEYPLDPVRRHIGQPFGSFGDGRMAAHDRKPLGWWSGERASGGSKWRMATCTPSKPVLPTAQCGLIWICVTQCHGRLAGRWAAEEELT